MLACAGLGGALNYLKERGELAHKVEWSGRTNDMKGEKLLGLDQVYEVGSAPSSPQMSCLTE